MRWSPITPARMMDRRASSGSASSPGEAAPTAGVVVALPRLCILRTTERLPPRLNEDSKATARDLFKPQGRLRAHDDQKGREPETGGSVAASPATKIVACRRASRSQSAVCGSGWASIAPVMMMSMGVASARMVRSRRPRARTCSSRFLISARTATILSSWMTGPPWRGRMSSLRAAIVCSKNCASVAGAGLVAQRGGARVLQHQVEGAQRQSH